MAIGDRLKTLYQRQAPGGTSSAIAPEASQAMTQGAPATGGGNAPKPPEPVYYNQAGGQYTPGQDQFSYWHNPAENQWYQGAQGGQVTAVPQAPWQTPLSTQQAGGGTTFSSGNAAFNPQTLAMYEQAFKNLGGEFATGQAPEAMMNQQISKLVEGLGARKTAAGQRLSAALGAQGVEGPAATSALQAQNRAAELGLSQGVADIRTKGLELGQQQRGQALQSYLQRLSDLGQLGATSRGQDVTMRGQDIERELGLEGQLTSRERAALEAALTGRGQDIDFQLKLMQLMGQGSEMDQQNVLAYLKAMGILGG